MGFEYFLNSPNSDIVKLFGNHQTAPDLTKDASYRQTIADTFRDRSHNEAITGYYTPLPVPQVVVCDQVQLC